MKRGWRISLKKWVLLVLALSLLAPQMAFAQETAVPKWQFGDMPASHWATKHVAKIGLLGITSGDDQGRYNPGKNISRQEAVIMAINLLGLQEEARANTIPVNLNGYGVANWAETAVKYAVVKGLIDLREESGIPQWGTGSASREWIAKLIVRAIGKEQEAVERDAEYTGFADDDSISEGYSGYINVAKSLNIIAGDNNRFNPTATITRAEMAVIFGQALQHLPNAHRQIVQGTLDRVGQDTISVRTASGVISYHLTQETRFYTHNSNTPIIASSLTPGDPIFLIQYGGTAYYVEKSMQSVSYETITGTFVNIYTDTSAGQPMRIEIEKDGKPETYPFTVETTFTSETGRGMKMSDLTVGSLIELSRVAGTQNITSVVVKRVVEKKQLIGTVERIIAGSVEIKDAVTGERLPLLDVPADVAILSGAREISLADLHIGDEVHIVLVDGVIEHFEVTQSVIVTVEGRVSRVDASGREIALFNPDNTTTGYFVERNATVSITGLSSPKISDVQAGDDVILELNADNRVQKVIVLNRSIDARIGLTFHDYVEDLNSLIYIEDGEVVTKTLTRETDIMHRFNRVELDEINQYFRKGDRIDLVFTGERIVRMSYAKSYTGVVRDISTRTNTITLDADDFGEVSFAYQNAPFVVMFGKSNATLADLLNGDRVRLELDNSQNRVQYIYIEQKQLFRVKDRQTYKLVVTDSAGKDHDVSGATSATVTHYDKLFAHYSDITVGDYVMITFDGSIATDIYIPRASYGVVESTDAIQNAFQFREYGKEARTVADNKRLEIGDRVSQSVTALKAGDRILLVEGADGLRLITPLAKQQRKVHRYIATSGMLQFTTSNLQEQSVFPVEEVYLHHKGNVISPTTLKREDVLNLYFHGDTLIEIEKP